MRINSNFVAQNSQIFHQQKSPFMNAEINGSDAKNAKRFDKNEITPKTLVEVLMEQKKNVTEQKYSMIGKHLEKGGDIQTIQSQLDAYDEQLKTLDMQIKTAQLSEQQKQEEEQNKAIVTEPMTEEEADAAHLSNLVSKSTSHEQTETIQNVQQRLEGESEALKTEIALDKKMNYQSNSKIQKQSELEQQVSALDNEVKQQNIELNKVEEPIKVEENKDEQSTEEEDASASY